MEEPSIFHVVADAIKTHGAGCVLIGGFAVNHYRVSRQTGDVDFLITKEDFAKIAGALERQGYCKEWEQENFVQLTSHKLSLMDLDFMFVDSETIAKITAEGEEVNIGGKKFIVPSLFHLIALKLHSIKYNSKERMMRDFPDIVNLLRVNKVDVKDAAFQALCLKYGTEDLFQKIREAIL